MSAGATVHTLRTASDAHALRSAAGSATSAAIIGAGFIGLELAASLRTMGLACHVVEAADRVLGRGVTPIVAQIVQDLHEANGVRFTFGRQVTRVTQGAIHLDDGTDVKADLIVAGIGSLANTELAEAAGLATANGITVGTDMRTSDPDGGVRRMRTSLYKDNETVPYAAPSWRHSARAAARLNLKLSLL